MEQNLQAGLKIKLINSYNLLTQLPTSYQDIASNALNPQSAEFSRAHELLANANFTSGLKGVAQEIIKRGLDEQSRRLRNTLVENLSDAISEEVVAKAANRREIGINIINDTLPSKSQFTGENILEALTFPDEDKKSEDE